MEHLACLSKPGIDRSGATAEKYKVGIHVSLDVLYLTEVLGEEAVHLRLEEVKLLDVLLHEAGGLLVNHELLKK